MEVPEPPVLFMMLYKSVTVPSGVTLKIARAEIPYKLPSARGESREQSDCNSSGHCCTAIIVVEGDESPLILATTG